MWINIVDWFVISGLLYTECQLLPHTYTTYEVLSRQHCISSGIKILISHHLLPRKTVEDKTALYLVNFGEPAQPLWFPRGRNCGTYILDWLQPEHQRQLEL